MALIRVALVGLSASAKTSWAAEGHLPYLLSARGRAHYKIVALLNSSVAAAEAARAHFSLPADVRAYGTAQDLADDAAVDLVVVNTRVDVHASVAEPSIRAGKPVFIEWPVAENAGRAAELAAGYASRADAHRSIVGFQGRFSPVVLKIKEVLAGGAVGAVLSSDIRAFANLTQRDAYPQGLAYFADLAVGGYPANISFGHMLDFVHDTLGQFVRGGLGFHARLQIQRPRVRVLDDRGRTLDTLASDVPDLVTLAGALEPGSGGAPGVETARDASLTVAFRNGPAFPGTPNLLWSIAGTKGELRVTSPDGPFLHSDSFGGAPIVIELHDFASDAVTNVPWDWADWQKELPVRTRVVAMLYEKYAAASADWAATEKLRDPKTGFLPEHVRWPTLLDGVYRHNEIAAMLDKWREE